MASRFVRKVRTASGAVAVQVVTREGRQVVEVDHVGSAHTDAELALLVQAAQERLHPGQEALDLGPLERTEARVSDVADWTASEAEPPAADPSPGRPRVVAAGGRVLSTSALVLWDTLAGVYSRLGFDVLDDEPFRALVLARIIEPTSKADTIRVLGEVGVRAPALNTIYRSLRRCQDRDYRGQLSKACLAHVARTTGKAALLMYDVTTLHFENENEDELRRVGMSKEHRVDPQVQVGLLVDPGGFPLEVALFEGNKGECDTRSHALSESRCRRHRW